MRLLIKFILRSIACGNSDMWYCGSINQQISIRSFHCWNRSLGRSWSVKHLIVGRSGIQNQGDLASFSKMKDVDWEEWVWLVAFVRIYMSFTRWHPTVQEWGRGSALRLCLSNIAKVTNQGTPIDSMQSAKSGFLKIWIIVHFIVLFIDRISS